MCLLNYRIKRHSIDRIANFCVKCDMYRYVNELIYGGRVKISQTSLSLYFPIALCGICYGKP